MNEFLTIASLDDPTLLALLASVLAAASSLLRWRSGERGNVLAQTAAELSSAAGQTVTNLMADNTRLRAENTELLRKLEDFEHRVGRLTQEIGQLQVELAAARRQHAAQIPPPPLPGPPA